MEISELTIENVTPVIREIVAEFGEHYVYLPGNEGCVYQENGKPSCLVGHVFDRMGVPYNQRWEEKDASWVISVNGGDEQLGFALRAAQYVQDDERSWGEALREFNKRSKKA
jgi:hypothetical protein